MKLIPNSVNQNIPLQNSSFATQVTSRRLLPSTRFNRLAALVFCNLKKKNTVRQEVHRLTDVLQSRGVDYSKERQNVPVYARSGCPGLSGNALLTKPQPLLGSRNYGPECCDADYSPALSQVYLSAHLQQDSPNAKRAEPCGLPLCCLVDLYRSARSVLLPVFAGVATDDAQVTVAVAGVGNVAVGSPMGSGLGIA